MFDVCLLYLALYKCLKNTREKKTSNMNGKSIDNLPNCIQEDMVYVFRHNNTLVLYIALRYERWRLSFYCAFDEKTSSVYVWVYLRLFSSSVHPSHLIKRWRLIFFYRTICVKNRPYLKIHSHWYCGTETFV